MKLLKRGLDTDAVVRRFLRERRILASLNHPNIAHLLDAGAIPDGRPYLVMEYVEGSPITRWCRQRGCSVRQILETMVAVCESVYAAHRQQVVHRDLKPSNVLVSEDGLPKLLDFGIAKLLGDDDGAMTRTSAALAPATPQYAAPEQLLGLPITPASDIFSLGILLYELLTGVLPPWRQGASMAIASARENHAIQRPSVVMARPDRPPPTAQERTDRGVPQADLDLIVLKAVENEPERRYATAAELADDLRRCLDGRPVLAQPQSRLYVARKFIVRNKVPVAAASAVLLALLVGFGTALWQAHVASLRAAELRTVVDFQSAMIKRVDVYRLGNAWLSRTRANIANRLQETDGANPSNRARLEDLDRLLPLSQPSDVARETLGSFLLAPADAEVEQRFGDNRFVAGSLHASLGRAYEDLGLYGAAVREFGSAVTAQSLEEGPLSPDTLASQLWLATAERDEGDYAAAEAGARAVIRGVARSGNDPRQLLPAQMTLASILTDHGEYAEAQKICDNILPRFKATFGADAPETLRAEMELSDTLLANQRNAEAEALIGHVMEVRRRTLGLEHLDTLAALQQFGWVLWKEGRYAQSRDRLREYLAVAQQVLGQDDPRTLQAKNILADALASLGDLRAAGQIDGQVLDSYIRQFGENNPRTLSAMHNHAITLATLDDYTGALPLERKVVESRRRSLGEDNPKTLGARFTLGEILQAMGDLPGALDAVRDAYQGQLKVLGAAHSSTLASEARLADILSMQGRWAEATPLAEHAMAVNTRVN